MARRAAHAAAKLVELGQTQLVGVLDDQGVDVGDVDAGLDDGGADQNPDLAVGHALHDVAELLLVHLAVGHGHLGVRVAGCKARGALVDGGHAVVQIVDLPAPTELAGDGVVQNRLVVLEHEGLHRVAVLGRLFDGGHIADARERHVERAGNGRG